MDEDKKGWSELVKELTSAGLATFFVTEDSVRNYLKEKKLPKEMVAALLEGITKKKEDFYGLLAKEFGKVLAKIDISREMEKFLEKHNVQFQAKISFERKEGLKVEETDNEDT